MVEPCGFVEFAKDAGRRRRMTVFLGDNTSKSSELKLMSALVETTDGARKMTFSTFAQVGRVRHNRPRQTKKIRMSVSSLRPCFRTAGPVGVNSPRIF